MNTVVSFSILCGRIRLKNRFSWFLVVISLFIRFRLMMFCSSMYIIGVLSTLNVMYSAVI